MEFENDTNYLDQHFLVNKSIINAFVDEAHLSVEESVVEIGPGKGQISDTLARRCGHLTCIEIDRNLEHFMNVLKVHLRYLKSFFYNNLFIKTMKR